METAFLTRITGEPDDVVARLVFADWLREQDDPALAERGEFIHIQHALATAAAPRADRPHLLARQKELLAHHRERWEEPLRGLAHGCEYRLGFAERVTLGAERFVDRFAELAARAPVVRVRLSGLTQDTVPFVAASESLARVRELDLIRQWITPAVLRELLASPHLARLRYLNLARTGVGDEGVRALVASNAFRRLRYLNLSHAGVGPAGVQTLVNAIYNQTPALEVLVMRGAPRVVAGAFPPVPHGLPRPLRQSLQSQLGLDLAPHDLLADLFANRAALSPDFRRWVEWLRLRGLGELSRAAKTLPLPDPVRAALALVCQRRAVWRAERAKADLPALPLSPDGHVDLAETIRLLVRTADNPAKEARALAWCLLDLYQRHERGELPLDGRTRAWRPALADESEGE